MGALHRTLTGGHATGVDSDHRLRTETRSALTKGLPPPPDRVWGPQARSSVKLRRFLSGDATTPRRPTSSQCHDQGSQGPRLLRMRAPTPRARAGADAEVPAAPRASGAHLPSRAATTWSPRPSSSQRCRSALDARWGQVMALGRWLESSSIGGGGAGRMAGPPSIARACVEREGVGREGGRR